MMNRVTRQLIQALLTLHLITMAVWPSPIAAQRFSRADSIAIVEKLRADSLETFSHWQSVALYCPANVSGMSTEETVCEGMFRSRQLMERLLGITVDSLRSPAAIGAASGFASHFGVLPIQLQLLTTGSANGANGMLASLRASMPSTHESRVEVPDRQAVAVSRSGELVIWEQSCIGASNDREVVLASEMADCVDTLMRKLLEAIGPAIIKSKK